MTRPRLEIYPVSSEPDETTQTEDLPAHATGAPRKLANPRTLRRVELAGLSLAVLTWSLYSMAHGPTRTPESNSAAEMAAKSPIVPTDQRDWQPYRTGERGENVDRGWSLPVYETDWSAHRVGERR